MSHCQGLYLYMHIYRPISIISYTCMLLNICYEFGSKSVIHSFSPLCPLELVFTHSRVCLKSVCLTSLTSLVHREIMTPKDFPAIMWK